MNWRSGQRRNNMGLLETLMSLFSPKQEIISPLQDNYNSPTPNPTPTLIPEAPKNPYMNLLAKYFPPHEVNNASNVMYKESSFIPDAPPHQNNDPYNSKDYGLYQGNDYWQRENLKKMNLTPQDLLDPETAIKFAAWLQKMRGWGEWSTSKSLGL